MFALPPLPIETESLHPDMSAQTLAIHHDGHHAAYVKKLNSLVDGTPLAEMTLDRLIETTRGSTDPAWAKVFNNAGQHWNHCMLWSSLSPEGRNGPPPELATRIEHDFGSLPAFREQFVKAGMEHFGSGWLWLVLLEGKLALTTTHDADSPLGTGATVLLCCDLWEHAYYLDHQNHKATYLEAFCDRMANWRFVQERLDAAPKAEGAEPDKAASSEPAPDPRVRFASPELLIAQVDIEEGEKVAMLEQWYLDLDNRLKAEEEGMSASDPMAHSKESRLADEAARVKACLAELSGRANTEGARQGH